MTHYIQFIILITFLIGDFATKGRVNSLFQKVWVVSTVILLIIGAVSS